VFEIDRKKLKFAVDKGFQEQPGKDWQRMCSRCLSMRNLQPGLCGIGRQDTFPV
jgi:hypothetical protein